MIGQTRERIGRRLGVTLNDRHARSGNDDLVGLTGDWLGGLEQPHLLLNGVSAVAARLEDGGGTMQDEYGEATLAVVTTTPARVELHKSYVRSGHQFVYVGRRSGGTMAGYWYSPKQPVFRGLFCFVRTDCLVEEEVKVVRGQVRTSSPRLAAVNGALITLLGAFLWSAFTVRVGVAVGCGALLALSHVILRSRQVALGRDADAWRELLG